MNARAGSSLLAALVSFAVLAAASIGCAPTRQQETAKNIDRVRAEATPARLMERGDIAALGGDMTRAEQYYVSALHAGADERVITTKLLLACVTDGRFPSAENYGEDYLRRHPLDTEVRYALATVYLARQELPQARAALEQVVGERPDLAEAHYALATVLQQESDASPEAADQQLREYIRLEPQGTYADAARASLVKSAP
ncbi:MAG TPA: tetratricopeptide repeat protein [Polyangiaceae bacterium]|jgi:tetratricopeptide (TPR) repeat protein|nr:tetratricopeptide repeat protein [Polyangiaceae bacterium]